MKNIIAKCTIILVLIITSGITFGQWTSVLDNVTPVDIAISPDYIHDQTVYFLDDEIRLYISETGGVNWTQLYEAENPSDPAQLVLDILLSPNYKNDDAIAIIHKDGTAELSADRGQHWFKLPVPDGTTGLVFSPKFMDDYKMFAVTGAYGPVKFYKSSDGGATWSFVSDLGLGGGFYCRLWNSADTASTDNMAVLYDNNTVYVTSDGGLTWTNSFTAQVSVRDLVFSPGFSVDSTVFVADASVIFKNESGGDELSWISKATFEGAYGIKFAMSPGYQHDQTIFAAVDQAGIIRSINGGTSWNDFNDGFGSSLPISIAISQSEPSTLFAGSMQSGGEPDKLWRFQTSSSISDQSNPANLEFRAFPNPGSLSTEIIFKTLSAGHVRLVIYDIAGKKLKVVVDEIVGKGLHQVNLDFEVFSFNPGIYFCRLEAGDRKQVIRIIAK